MRQTWQVHLCHNPGIQQFKTRWLILVYEINFGLRLRYFVKSPSQDTHVRFQLFTNFPPTMSLLAFFPRRVRDAGKALNRRGSKENRQVSLHFRAPRGMNFVFVFSYFHILYTDIVFIDVYTQVACAFTFSCHCWHFAFNIIRDDSEDENFNTKKN